MGNSQRRDCIFGVFLSRPCVEEHEPKIGQTAKLSKHGFAYGLILEMDFSRLGAVLGAPQEGPNLHFSLEGLLFFDLWAMCI